MSTLNSQDFENVFKFYINLNNSYENFENITLRLMSEFFDMRLTTYAIFDLDKKGDSFPSDVKSNAFRMDPLEQYKEYYYKKDLFYSNINHIIFASKYVYTSDSFPTGVFTNSEYGRWLASYNVGYQAVLGGNISTSFPMHVLCVYKTIDSGGFTPRELELMHYIGKAFNKTMGLYKKHLNQQRLKELTGYLLDSLSMGYAILNSNLEPLSYNTQFISYGTKISNKMDASGIVGDLANIIRTKSTKNFSIVDKLEVKCLDYVLTLQQKKLFTSQKIETFFYLTIISEDTASQNKESPIELLTNRELEVMELLRDGLGSSEIANFLSVSHSTAKSHIRNLSIKLGASSQEELLQIIDDHSL